ncbi:hypothetical protein C1H46_043437 [Malus baccata]|uniref:Serine-threonine/tyrosine-protein kinase catalytic domain-containing protein n=1 Tax=Malus baccata TaxID=106549 RepID=A0A540K9V4_MALBA|nr:hypothetical protein C1H46_043437 [Malus baccata]
MTIASELLPWRLRAGGNPLIILELTWWSGFGISLENIKFLKQLIQNLVEFSIRNVKCLMIVGLWCAHPDYSMRPSMQQVMQMFTFEVPLPILPSKMPVATYFPLPRSLSMLFSDNNVTGGGQTEASCHGSYNTTTSSSYIP